MVLSQFVSPLASVYHCSKLKGEESCSIGSTVSSQFSYTPPTWVEGKLSVAIQLLLFSKSVSSQCSPIPLLLHQASHRSRRTVMNMPAYPQLNTSRNPSNLPCKLLKVSTSFYIMVAGM